MDYLAGHKEVKTAGTKVCDGHTDLIRAIAAVKSELNRY